MGTDKLLFLISFAKVKPSLYGIITSNKHKYAWNAITRKPNILIDDKPDNIKRWTEAGGIGIRFQTNEDDLEEYLFVELEKAIERARTFEFKNKV